MNSSTVVQSFEYLDVINCLIVSLNVSAADKISLLFLKRVDAISDSKVKSQRFILTSFYKRKADDHSLYFLFEPFEDSTGYLAAFFASFSVSAFSRSILFICANLSTKKKTSAISS